MLWVCCAVWWKQPLGTTPAWTFHTGCRSFPASATVSSVVVVHYHLCCSPPDYCSLGNPLMLQLKNSQNMGNAYSCTTLESSCFYVLQSAAWRHTRMPHHSCSSLLLTVASSGHGKVPLFICGSSKQHQPSWHLHPWALSSVGIHKTIA